MFVLSENVVKFMQTFFGIIRTDKIVHITVQGKHNYVVCVNDFTTQCSEWNQGS